MADDFGAASRSHVFKTEEDLKQRILSSVGGSFRGDETNRWIAAIKDDELQSAEEALTTEPSQRALSDSMSTLMDKLFDQLKRYSFEFNRIQESRENQILCERPSSMRASEEYHVMGKPIKYCLGHLAGKDWSLVILGEEDRIRGYVVPPQFIMGFRPEQDEFPTYIDISLARQANSNSSIPVWNVNGQALSEKHVGTIARRLFTHLVRVTRGETPPDEKFLFDPQELKIVKPDVVVDRSFEREAVGVNTYENLDLAHINRKPNQVAGDTQNQVAKFQSQSQPLPVVNQAAVSHSENLKVRASELLRPAGANRPPVEIRQDNLTPAPTPSPNTNFHVAPTPAQQADVARQSTELNRNIAHALKNLFDTVDSSITNLTNIGVTAMHEDDLETVSKVMQRCKSLRNMREGIVQLSKDWQKSLESGPEA